MHKENGAGSFRAVFPLLASHVRRADVVSISCGLRFNKALGASLLGRRNTQFIMTRNQS
jgi:hypothetical protein